MSPVIDMLASTSAHFARLKQFIEVQLPAGFPMQIEVPLVHMIGAQVTFENIMCNERSVSGVNGVSRMCVAARARSHWVLQLPCNTCVLQLNLIRLPISMHAQLTKPSSTCRCRMRASTRHHRIVCALSVRQVCPCVQGACSPHRLVRADRRRHQRILVAIGNRTKSWPDEWS